MKWSVPRRPKHGEHRIRRRFALFPIWIDSPQESVGLWLEWYYVHEMYRSPPASAFSWWEQLDAATKREYLNVK
jgi:hypothetical protein